MLPPIQRGEYVTDLVLQAGIEVDMEWNPICRKAIELQDALDRRGLYRGHGYEPLEHPGLPEFLRAANLFRDGLFAADMEIVRKRIDALKKADRVGGKVTVNTAKGQIAAIVWMRNIEGFGVSATSLVRDIAELLAFKRAADLSGDQLL